MLIGGTEIKVSVKFSDNDHREYIDIVSELQDELANTIERLGHEFIILTSEPINKEELQ